MTDAAIVTTTTQLFSDWAWVAGAVVFNGSVGYAFLKTFSVLTIREIVAEKVDTSPGGDPREQTSSARVISFLGGLIVTMFLWAAGNVAIYNGLVNPTQAKEFLNSIQGYVLPGAALFLPYAVNRLSDVMKTGQTSQADVETAKVKANANADVQKAKTDAAADKATSDAAIATEKAKTDALTRANAAKQVANTEVDTAVAAGQLDAAKVKAIVEAAIKATTGAT
jgi:hypothetical protein